MTNIQIRPNKSRGLIVLFLLSSMMILQVIVSILEQFHAHRIIENFTPSISDSFYNDTSLLILHSTIILVYVCTIVCYIRWFRRAYFNLNNIAAPLRYKNGWAAGSWFIPGFHWVGPFQIMFELYSKTRSFLIKKNILVSGRWIFVLLVLWWLLYFFSGANTIYSMFVESPDLHDFNAFKSFIDKSLIFSVVQILLTLFATIVVLVYYKLERHLELIPEIKVAKPKAESPGLIDSSDVLSNVKEILE